MSKPVEYRGYQIVKNNRRFIILLNGQQVQACGRVADAPNLDTAKGDIDRLLRG